MDLWPLFIAAVRFGGDATAAAGPNGRDASAQTGAMMHAEMLSYSRSRGLFAAISVEEATLRPDEATSKLRQWQQSLNTR
jgi:lipid-binding SYLF domain-containing protein